MAILGTKKFWIPAQGASPIQKENQILKNTGYINIQLHSVNYMSVGNFWQKKFRGKDNIVLATNFKYPKNQDTIEAISVQDVRRVKTDENYNLGLQRNIAVKIPANADEMAIDVKMTAIKNDMLQAKFDMLNKPEYQSALQLAPIVVGQIITVTSLVKNLFTESDGQSQLEASYAGIISNQRDDNPISKGKLTQGSLIMISTNDGNQFNNVDDTKFELRGDTLFYKNKQVENTYIIFNISFDELKGADENANWFKKYNEAFIYLDKIHTVNDQFEIEKIFLDSKTMWIEGNALLDDDDSYINTERIKIKNLVITQIKDKYRELTQPVVPLSLTSDIFQRLSGTSHFDSINEALPAVGRFVNKKYRINITKAIDDSTFDSLSKDVSLNELIDKDAENYLDHLKANNLVFKLGIQK